MIFTKTKTCMSVTNSAICTQFVSTKQKSRYASSNKRIAKYVRTDTAHINRASWPNKNTTLFGSTSKVMNYPISIKAFLSFIYVYTKKGAYSRNILTTTIKKQQHNFLHVRLQNLCAVAAVSYGPDLLTFGRVACKKSLSGWGWVLCGGSVVYKVGCLQISKIYYYYSCSFETFELLRKLTRHSYNVRLIS